MLDNGAVSISTPELGDDVARALGNMRALLLKNHGSVVAGADDCQCLRHGAQAGEGRRNDVARRFSHETAGNIAAAKAFGFAVDKQSVRLTHVGLDQVTLKDDARTTGRYI